MTDNSGIAAPRAWRVQGWHGVLAAGLAVLTAAAVVLVVRSTDPASADTYVTSVRNAVVRLADGRETTAHVGTRLARGAELRTGEAGGAELSTAGRKVYVGALSTVRVTDGVRQSLVRGQLMVDSRRGPRLGLTTLAGTVAAAAGGLVRVETAAVLRVAVFEGSAVVTPTARRATTRVGALHQVQVAYLAMPGRVTPLALRDDRWEIRLAGGLVSADQDLSHLADSLAGSDGTALLTAAPAALRTAVTSAPGAAPGELALTAALAQAATGGGSLTDRFAAVSAARNDGGSWGVVAALVGARVTAVSALLDSALTPRGSTPVAAVPAAGIPGLFGPSASPTPAATGSSGPKVTPKPTPTRKPRTTASPTPGLVDGLVNTVLSLVPHPTVAPGTVVTPAPARSPLINLNLNLGGH